MQSLGKEKSYFSVSGEDETVQSAIELNSQMEKQENLFKNLLKKSDCCLQL